MRPNVPLSTLLVIAICHCLLSPAFAREYPRLPKKTKANSSVNFRSACTTAQAQFDMDINNVRARLLTGGDMWWNRNDGKYVVPKPLPGQPEVSSIYAAGIWMGGYDSGGSLKVACQTYGNNGGDSDYWPGPLNLDEGITEPQTCNNWDRLFEVKGADIRTHIQRWQQSLADGVPYDDAQIPLAIKGWPSRGNPFFTETHGFDLPNQYFADFFDQDDDGTYEPSDGDFPMVGIQSCFNAAPQIPDQLIFWIYNDEGAGATHGQTNGIPIRMEIQATAFAYATDDQLNDMTFQRHKFINRAKEDIDSTYFGLWMDADLGCHLDDYTGCDTSRSLAYTYNVDAQDGQPGTTCEGGVTTYGVNIPVVGVDIFRGPNENGKELGMSSFMYFSSSGSPPPGTTDPYSDVEFYNYLSGSWKDGTPLSYGGDGYDPTVSAPLTKYAFPSPPNDPNGWSMCHPGPEFPNTLPSYDRRTVQSCGPFILQPGAVNELTFGVVWTPSMDYPCPDLSRFFSADDLAQCVFDNCFELLPSMFSPKMDFVELDKEIVLLLSNNSPEIVSVPVENYNARIPCDPNSGDSTYTFEGYLVYQVASPNVDHAQLDDPEKARLLFNTDLKNGVKAVYNWQSLPNPNYDPTISGSKLHIYYPEVQVEGIDDGLKHSFRVSTDAFAEGDSLLINHRKYYFMAKGYAYNQYQPFDPNALTGQRTEYFDRGYKTIFSATPRPITDVQLNANYGDQFSITRLDGVGVGGNFVDIDDATLQRILDGSFTGEIGYLPGRAPIDVKVYNPLALVVGEYEITFTDENMNNDTLDGAVHWQLRRLGSNDQAVVSDYPVEVLNEQLFAQYGFSVSIWQTSEAGDCSDPMVGAIGADFQYGQDTGPHWFSAINDDYQFFGALPFVRVLNFLPETTGSACDTLPLAEMSDGQFVPYGLCRSQSATGKYLTPAWRHSANLAVNGNDWATRLNNVDIIFTPDKSLWSRCVVVEMFNHSIAASMKREDGTTAASDNGARHFDRRKSPSVGKDDADGDGLPDPDGDGIGMGWFPGYAVDVETGKRLNIFFGENSAFGEQNGFLSSYPDGRPNGADMLFNPNSQLLLEEAAQNNFLRYYIGGHHFIYITDEAYDGCAYLRTRFDPDEVDTQKVNGLRKVTWTSFPLMPEGMSLLPLSQGLIPNELHIKLRVNNPFAVATGTGESNGYPTYRFKVDGLAPKPLVGRELKSVLDWINIAPNPYYNPSAYADYVGNGVVKITNLPAKCTVTIYTMEGKMVRQFKRDEQPGQPNGSGIEQTQIAPDLEWDLTTVSGNQLATGVYLVHVTAPGIGERTLKLAVI